MIRSPYALRKTNSRPDKYSNFSSLLTASLMLTASHTRLNAYTPSNQHIGGFGYSEAIIKNSRMIHDTSLYYWAQCTDTVQVNARSFHSPITEHRTALAALPLCYNSPHYNSTKYSEW